MEWTCEEASLSPREDDGWELLYKIVPAVPPREGYPDYRVGCLYRHEGEVVLCCPTGGRRAEPPYGGRRGDPYSYSKGFHASQCYTFCKKYVETLDDARYLKVLLHVKEEDNDKKVGDQLYVLEEQTASEVEAMVTVCRTLYGAIYHIRGLGLHREDKDEQGLTLPAVIDADGTFGWWRDGKLHREDKDKQGLTLPAVIWPNDTRFWFKNGKRHREDRDARGHLLPAVIRADGAQAWYLNGKCHREDRDEQGHILPAEICAGGSKGWYRDGLCHRDDRDAEGHLLPAMIEVDGTQKCYLNGIYQRSDRDEQGHVIDANDNREWWLDGEKVSPG